MTPEDFVAAVSDPFQNIGALHYFGPKAKAAAEGLGIDQFRFYFAGRGGVLGEVSNEVMQSSFGYFNPQLVAKMWSSSKERCDVTAAAAAGSTSIACLSTASVAPLVAAATAVTTASTSGVSCRVRNHSTSLLGIGEPSRLGIYCRRESARCLKKRGK